MNFIDIKMHGTTIKTKVGVKYLGWEGVNSIKMAEDREEGRALVNMVTKLHVLLNSGNVMYS